MTDLLQPREGTVTYTELVERVLVDDEEQRARLEEYLRARLVSILRATGEEPAGAVEVRVGVADDRVGWRVPVQAIAWNVKPLGTT